MLLAVDTETTGTDFFHGCRPFMITACDGQKNYVFECDSVNKYTREVTWYDEVLDEFRHLVQKATRVIMHNANFDIRALESVGTPSSLFEGKIEDTLIASHCICSGDTHNLKDLAVKYLNYSDEDEHILEDAVKEAIRYARSQGWAVAKHGHPHFPGLHKASKFWAMDYWLAMDACRNYAVRDVERTLLLWDAFKPSLLADNLWDVYQFRKKLLPIAYKMQSVGKNFYRPEAQALVDRLVKEMEELRWEIKRIAGIPYRFDPNKRQHLIDLIHKRLAIPIQYYTDSDQTTPSMDQKALDAYFKEYKSPALQLLAKYKKNQKQVTEIQGTLNWLDENNRTHSSLNITGTRSTRQSSNSPNDQNTDKVLRHLFGPPPGYVWISTDLVNIELRIWAYTVNNRELIEAFEQGKSVHQMVMEIVFPDYINSYLSAKKKQESQLTEREEKALKMYGRIKNGNFARIYGATDNKTNETYHGGKNAPNYCAKIDSRFPGIKEFTKTRIAMAERNLVKYSTFAVHTLGGYRLDVSPSEPFTASNYFVQGSAGMVTSESMIMWSEHPLYKKFGCQMISQVHDSIDTEVKITPALPVLIEAKCKTISKAGQKYIPTCEASWKIIYHPSDETNPIIQELLHQ